MLQRFITSQATLSHLIILFSLLSGCAATNVMQFQDAKTLAAGTVRSGTYVANGPNLLNLLHDSTRQLGTTFDPTMGIFGRYGVAEQWDIGGMWWFSNVPLLYLPFTGAMDSGLKGDIKWQITPPTAEEQVALKATLSGYYTLNSMVTFEEHTLRGFGGTWSMGAEALYSFSWSNDPSAPNNSSSVYVGVGLLRIANHYHYSTTSNPTREDIKRASFVALSPFAGLRLMDKAFLEISSLYAQNPLNNGYGWGVFVGMAVR